jgi:hypothetical protein
MILDELESNALGCETAWPLPLLFSMVPPAMAGVG